MRDDRLTDEDEYFATREEQLVRRLGLPPQSFIDYGTNAEMRWDAVPGLGYFIPNERFFVRDHTSTPLIDHRSWA